MPDSLDALQYARGGVVEAPAPYQPTPRVDFSDEFLAYRRRRFGTPMFTIKDDFEPLPHMNPSVLVSMRCDAREIIDGASSTFRDLQQFYEAEYVSARVSAAFSLVQAIYKIQRRRHHQKRCIRKALAYSRRRAERRTRRNHVHSV